MRPSHTLSSSPSTDVLLFLVSPSHSFVRALQFLPFASVDTDLTFLSPHCN
jgi:hypothetical protein